MFILGENYEITSLIVVLVSARRSARPLFATKSNSPIGDDPMPSPTIAQKSPFPVAVESGKSYFWCACGKSSKQPFCDGSHKGSEFAPAKWDAVESKTVYFCGC